MTLLQKPIPGSENPGSLISATFTERIAADVLPGTLFTITKPVRLNPEHQIHALVAQAT